MPERTPIMSDKQGIDRRDLLIASIATAGASAALVANVGAANAQDIAASSQSLGSHGTVYTGDVIQGKKVVSASS
jgi:uncharacterized protein